VGERLDFSTSPIKGGAAAFARIAAIIGFPCPNEVFMKLIKLSQVMAKTTLSKSTIYRLIKTSDFPLPKKLSLRAVAWLETEIDEWIVNRGCACNSSSNHSISTLQAYLLNNTTTQ